MPASPARNIISVESSVVVIESNSAQEMVPFDLLSRVELIKSAAIRFPNSGIRWTELSNDEIRTALTSGAVPDQSPREPSPVPIPAPTPTPTVTPNGLPSIDAAIRDLIARTASSVIDESRVREIAEQAILSHASEFASPTVTVFEFPNIDPIHYEGTHHEKFPAVLRALHSGNHVYLVGPPGTGKTRLAHDAARALSLEFGSISCSPTMPDSRLFGYFDAHGNYVRTIFRDRYENGGVFLFDEIDNAHPGVLASINQALANDYCAFPDGMVRRHERFLCVAAANTFGTGPDRKFVGRNAQDLALLDRFAFMVIGIDESLETTLTRSYLPQNRADEWLAYVRKCRANVESHNLDIVISPRASINGAKLLAAGFDVGDVVEMVIAKGMTIDQRAKVLPQS